MHIWEKCDGIPGTPVVARQASYEEKRTKQFKSVDQRWISITFSDARWPYWKSNTTRKISCWMNSIFENLHKEPKMKIISLAVSEI